jgi:hypothetical protein
MQEPMIDIVKRLARQNRSTLTPPRCRLAAACPHCLHSCIAAYELAQMDVQLRAMAVE